MGAHNTSSLRVRLELTPAARQEIIRLGKGDYSLGIEKMFQSHMKRLYPDAKQYNRAAQQLARDSKK